MIVTAKLTEDQKRVVAEMHAMMKAEGGATCKVEEFFPLEDQYRIQYLSADGTMLYESWQDLSDAGCDDFWAQAPTLGERE